VQRAVLYFGFDYAVQRFDRIAYLLLADWIIELFNHNSSDHGFAQTRIGRVSLFFMAYDVRARGDDFVYPDARAQTLRAGMHRKWLVMHGLT
jgi:hypothetical protein